MNRLSAAEILKKLPAGIPLIDVRAPVEFEVGSIPGAVNLPILENEERRLIGTTYKQEGSEVAINLGHEIVSGENRDRKIAAWIEALRKNPDSVVYCFRGGLRSQITQMWLKESGFDVPIVEGGYKSLRQSLLQVNESIQSYQKKMHLIAGPTGSGKTSFLKELASQLAVIDLEGLAKHRGSAFGEIEFQKQPSQVDFENTLAVELLRHSEFATIFCEDESRLIGRRGLPEAFWGVMKEAPLIVLDESLDVRIQSIFADYIANTSIGLAAQTGFQDMLQFECAKKLLESYEVSLSSIQRRLGGLRFQEIYKDFLDAKADFLENGSLNAQSIWIEKLLVYYYDPMYIRALDSRSHLIKFRGDRGTCYKYCLGK